MNNIFIQWAGGKTQLLNEIEKYYPTSFTKYCELFLGGGAVLFDMLTKFKLKEVLVNDINENLIITYNQIKHNVYNLMDSLQLLQNNYRLKTLEEKRAFFHEQKQRYNTTKISNLETATVFIFLNKTCFNGLYRVNSEGEYNTSFGTGIEKNLYNPCTLLKLNKLLQNVNIVCGDYKKCEHFIDSDTFVYIDPPYRPISKTANHNCYDKQGFNDKSQIELFNFIQAQNNKGARILASNSDPKNTNADDNFFDDLYKNYYIKRVLANRTCSGNATSRGKINELLISNFKAKPDITLFNYLDV